MTHKNYTSDEVISNQSTGDSVKRITPTQYKELGIPNTTLSIITNLLAGEWGEPKNVKSKNLKMCWIL
jgi:hypothetical protein